MQRRSATALIPLLVPMLMLVACGGSNSVSDAGVLAQHEKCDHFCSTVCVRVFNCLGGDPDGGAAHSCIDDCYRTIRRNARDEEDCKQTEDWLMSLRCADFICAVGLETFCPRRDGGI